MLGFVVGLRAEARIASRFGHKVLAGGGTAFGASTAAERLVSEGATALVSFGLAGGLDPSLRPGTIVIPCLVQSGGTRSHTDAALAAPFGGLSDHTILAGSAVAASAAEKRRLRAETQADAIDLESGGVATIARGHGLPFIVIRAICDPAERDLPPAALLALDPSGRIRLISVLRSVLGHPGQIPALLAIARDARQARRALLRLAQQSNAATEPQADVRTSNR